MSKFIDIDRVEVNKMFNDFLESSKDDNIKNIENLENIIRKDPNFFDPYLILHDNYISAGDLKKASSILGQGYENALKLIVKDGEFPTQLLWAESNNRHIIKIIYNYAMFLWTMSEYENALYIFMQLLKADNEDKIGARYYILAILEQFENIDHFEEHFKINETQNIDSWFMKKAKNYEPILGWWLEL